MMGICDRLSLTTAEAIGGERKGEPNNWQLKIEMERTQAREIENGQA